MLSSGKLCVSYCEKCLKFNWPVSPFCSTCSSKTELKPYPHSEGRIIELSIDKIGGNSDTFGLIQMGDVRLIGAVINPKSARAGGMVKLESCGVSSGKPFFNFRYIGGRPRH